MGIIDQLATSLGRKDQVPNQDLAKNIVLKNDKRAVKELVENLQNKNKNVQSDCIKVLYEIGEKKPALISEYVENFVKLLSNENNRLQWGAMTALDSITLENPKIIYSALAKIVSVSDSGSVITKDHAVSILTKLCTVKQYSEDAFSLLIEQLLTCPTNQLPMYAENAIIVVNEKNKKLFIKTLTSRLNEIEKETKRKRVEKVLKKLSWTHFLLDINSKLSIFTKKQQ